MSTSSEVTKVPAWRTAGLRYYSYNHFLRSKFHGRVQKVSVDAGFTCPNDDGTLTTGGCVFCDNRSFSPSRRVRRQQILDQINDGIRRLKTRYDCNQFLAYFQPGTNTYGPVEKLQPLYEAALEHPQVVGLAIGTRPDCLPEPVLAMLESLAESHYLSLEIGMQTMHDRSLTWMNRAHDHACTVDAVSRARGRGFELCVHIMLGLPGESPDDMLATADEVARLGVDAVKIHHLYAVRNTPLGEDYQAGKVELLDQTSYINILLPFLERLPPGCVVERVMGDAPPKYLLGPLWCLDKPAFQLALKTESDRRDTWQGKGFVSNGPALPE